MMSISPVEKPAQELSLLSGSFYLGGDDMADEFVPRKECALLCEKLEAEDKHQNERIDKLEKSQAHITELTISVKELALEVKNMVSEISSQNTRIKTLENRDGEKWRSVVKIVATAVLSAVIGAVLMMIGLK